MSDQMLVVVDVDNTLYDWVALWAGAFGSMVKSLAAQTDRGADQWMTQAHAVHMRRGSTECPSLLADMADAATWPIAIDASRVLPSAAAAYRDYWDHHLTPYPGVREALTQLAARGHTIVAYTEGDVSIAASRIARIGLAGLIRRVFGRSPLPVSRPSAWCTVSALRNCPVAVDFIPREDTKPNPLGLRTIVSQCGATVSRTVYMGDNLWKDVGMAQTLGAGAFWARYGTVRNPEHVVLLERVAHWRAADVIQESRTTTDRVRPDAIIETPIDLPDAVARRSEALAATT